MAATRGKYITLWLEFHPVATRLAADMTVLPNFAICKKPGSFAGGGEKSNHRRVGVIGLHDFDLNTPSVRRMSNRRFRTGAVDAFEPN